MHFPLMVYCTWFRVGGCQEGPGATVVARNHTFGTHIQTQLQQKCREGVCVSLSEREKEGERNLMCVHVPQIVTADLVELRDVSVHDVQMGRSSIKVVMMLVCLHTWTRHVYLSI